MAGALLYAPKFSTGEKPAQGTPRPMQRATVGGGAFYSAFECADGTWIQLGCVHNRFVQLAAGVLGVKEAMADPRFGDGRNVPTEEARKELFGMVADAIKTRPYEEWASLFEEADVPYALVRTTQEAMDDPQVRLNDMVIQADDPALGAVTYMGLPVKLTGTPGRVHGARPVPGQHTDQVLSALSEAEPQSSSVERPGAEALPQPLDGVKVLETANVIAGPTAGKLLSVLGAEVIKMEPPDGDISRPSTPAYFYLLNSNKRSISINARTEEGREVAKRIAAQADILVANMRPGATDRIGIGAEALNELNPTIIEAHVTAFGWTGPYSHRPGLDPLAQALIGLQRAQGGPENPPVFLGGIAPDDYVAGALGALGAIMALYARERGGFGQQVHTNLLNAGILLSSREFMKFRGKPPRRHADKGQYGLSALHRLYETAEGWIYLAAEGEGYWPGLCSALDREDLASDPRFASPNARAENDAALALELEQTLRGRASAEWLSALEEKEVPCAPVIEGYGEGFFSDPQAIANEMIVEHQRLNAGSYKISRNLIRFGNTSDVKARATPLLGQHTREVLEELGYSQSEIDELYRKGVAITE
jgi:crotonobetainyl-CoA:carnitine CoA-transferase CaiB-like acyl-CoA transferase